MLPDMIEIGSFIGMAAMTQSEILIKDARVSELGQIPDKFRQLGIRLEIQGDDIFVPNRIFMKFKPISTDLYLLL